jgi:hypothetical protein
MKTTFLKIGNAIRALAFVIIFFIYGCDYILHPMSEIIEDTTAGMNGSFEVVKMGLPVN